MREKRTDRLPRAQLLSMHVDLEKFIPATGRKSSS